MHKYLKIMQTGQPMDGPEKSQNMAIIPENALFTGGRGRCNMGAKRGKKGPEAGRVRALGEEKRGA